MKPCDYCDSRCKPCWEPCSKPKPNFWPLRFNLGPLRVHGSLTDSYFTVRVDWPGKRLRLEDEA